MIRIRYKVDNNIAKANKRVKNILVMTRLPIYLGDDFFGDPLLKIYKISHDE